MRIRTGINLLALGLGVGAIFAYRATRAPRGGGARRFSDLAPDPDDPVQGFDEVSDLEISPLDVDALSTEGEPADEGELADEDRAVADGQNWIEALETSVIEDGGAPGRPLAADEVSRTPHASSRRDTPVADLGSGGRRGR